MARTIEDRKRTLIAQHKRRMTENSNGISLGTSGSHRGIEGRPESTEVGKTEGREESTEVGQAQGCPQSTCLGETEGCYSSEPPEVAFDEKSYFTKMFRVQREN
jgi:hypothetical protein